MSLRNLLGCEMNFREIASHFEDNTPLSPSLKKGSPFHVVRLFPGDPAICKAILKKFDDFLTGARSTSNLSKLYSEGEIEAAHRILEGLRSYFSGEDVTASPKASPGKSQVSLIESCIASCVGLEKRYEKLLGKVKEILKAHITKRREERLAVKLQPIVRGYLVRRRIKILSRFQATFRHHLFRKWVGAMTAIAAMARRRFVADKVVLPRQIAPFFTSHFSSAAIITLVRDVCSAIDLSFANRADNFWDTGIIVRRGFLVRKKHKDRFVVHVFPVSLEKEGDLKGVLETGHVEISCHLSNGTREMSYKPTVTQCADDDAKGKANCDRLMLRKVRDLMKDEPCLPDLPEEVFANKQRLVLEKSWYNGSLFEAERGPLPLNINRTEYKELSMSDKVLILHDIATFLEKLHARGIVHLGVNSNNILISVRDKTLSAVLVAWNSARFIGLDNERVPKSWSIFSQEGCNFPVRDSFGLVRAIGEVLLSPTFFSLSNWRELLESGEFLRAEVKRHVQEGAKLFKEGDAKVVEAAAWDVSLILALLDKCDDPKKGQMVIKIRLLVMVHSLILECVKQEERLNKDLGANSEWQTALKEKKAEAIERLYRYIPSMKTLKEELELLAGML